MEEIQEKIQELQNEILALKESTDTYQEELYEEIHILDEQIQEADLKNLAVQSEIKSRKQDYQRSESQIVTLQYSLEDAKNTLKSRTKLRNELENLNDHWEKSIRTLEFYNTGLESQLNQTESYVVDLHSKIQDTSVQYQESLVKIQAECEEIKQAIKRPSRSPSPQYLKPPVSPRSQMQISKAGSINITIKPDQSSSDLPEPTFTIVVISPDNLYIGENAVVIKEKSLKKIIEFRKVVKRSEFLSELVEPARQAASGKNSCIVLSSGKNREQFVMAVLKKLSVLLDGAKAECHCAEIVKDNVVNLFPFEWRAISMGVESEAVVCEGFNRLSKGKNHMLTTFRFRENCLQVLDLGEINEDQSFTESLSINASLFYLEELMMNLSKGKPKFDKSNLTKRLEMSLQGSFCLTVLMSFDDVADLPVLGLAARLQSMFYRSKTEHEQVHRSLAMLEKERLANFEVLRLIEKAQKDMLLLKKLMKTKDENIETLQKKLKSCNFDRVQSLSPTLLDLSKKPSKIPRPIRKS